MAFNTRLYLTEGGGEEGLDPADLYVGELLMIKHQKDKLGITFRITIIIMIIIIIIIIIITNFKLYSNN